jgi:hypothetical protein
LVFEVLFLIVSVTGLGAWLLAREAFADWRRAYRGRRVSALLAVLEGGPISRAEATLGPPTEIVTGIGGRCLYVWKAPASRDIPAAAPLLIVTLIADAQGLVTQASWEER